MVTSSSTPTGFLSSARVVHLAAGGPDGVPRVNLARHLPAPAGVLLVERLFLADPAEVRDVHRLEELMIIGSHEAVTAAVDGDVHTLELGRDLSRLERIRRLGGFDEHANLIDGPGI